MCGKWSSLLNSGKIIGVLLIDFSKGFDSVCHQTLLKKLIAIGISGDMFEWCKSYFTSRQQFVVIGNSKSGRKPVEQGVPQGSLLGPRCYSYHANDLTDVIKQSTDTDDNHDVAEMFADDTTQFSVAKTVDHLIPKIQEAANRLQNWSTLNGMVIHPGKTKVMIVSKRKRSSKRSKFITPIQNITMSGRNLEVVESQKVLGVTIDNLLVWKTHLEIVLKHFRTKIKMLKRMNVLGQEVINKFYYSTIIPSVTYNITVWGNSNTITKQLDILHAKAARLI